MINLPYNIPLMSQSVPVQTNQSNFPGFQQPQTVTQQMQTPPSVPYPGNLQDPYKQPIYQLHQSDVFVANHQYVPNMLPPRNPYPPVFQAPPNIPPTMQAQPQYGPLPPNVLEQIRGYASNVPPIFILPNSCQGSNHSPGAAQPPGPTTGFNYPPPVYCPPSFFPYPVPLPIYEPPTGQAPGRDRGISCGCCQRRQECRELKKHLPTSCCCSVMEQEEHQCTATNDDTICSKRNCPASISLQALASQFLCLPGIISCAATRLILRKVPGSNINTTMEDTMDKAQRSISVLTKDQLLTESRNAQQVHALINLHMTTNPPANIIPLLTLLQIKVNVLKAQVESLINKKVMECQGYGFEVETSGAIDPAVLALKTNAELRQLLSALRQKETDERVNANFSPYSSQRVIAESRLNNVQAKIRQVEAEFENRRCASLPVPTPALTSRIIQQFAESRCTFGFAQTKLFEPYTPETVFESPDPFSMGPRNPRRLYLKPHVPEMVAQRQKDENKATSTSEDGASKNQATGEDQETSKEESVERKCSGCCNCDRGSSSESFDEDKKKLRVKIDGKQTVRPGVSEVEIIQVEKIVSSTWSLVIEEPVAGEDQSEFDETGKTERSRIRSDNFRFPKESRVLTLKDEPENVENLETTNLRESTIQTMLKAIETEFPEDNKVLEVKTIFKDLFKDLEVDNEPVIKGKVSALWNPDFNTKNQQTKETTNKSSSSTNEINLVATESKTENEKENTQVVSIMTSIEYNKSLNFGSWMVTRNYSDKGNINYEENVIEIPLSNTTKTDILEENHVHPSLHKMNSSVRKSALTNTDNEEQKIERNTFLRRIFRVKSNLMKDCQQYDEKAEIRRFPPLEHAANRGATTIASSENVFHQKEIESDSSRTVYDASTSYQRGMAMESGIVSSIYSVIESRLVSLGSLLGNIPNLQKFLLSFRCDRRTSESNVSDDNMKLNKRVFSREDWSLLPDDDDKRNSVGNYFSVKEGCNRARKVKQSIIVDEESQNYVIIRGSISSQLRVLSNKGLERPYKVRRSLIIRSRLKNPKYSKCKCLSPFTILKRARRNKVIASQVVRKKENEFRNSKKFCSLSDVLNNTNTLKPIISSDRFSSCLFNKQENDVFANTFENSLTERNIGCFQLQRH